MAKTHTKGEGIRGGCIPSCAKNESPLLKLNSFKQNTKRSQLKNFMVSHNFIHNKPVVRDLYFPG